jgi:hypothetical protein
MTSLIGDHLFFFYLLSFFFVAVATSAMGRHRIMRIAHVNVRERTVAAVYVEFTFIDVTADTAIDFFLFHGISSLR